MRGKLKITSALLALVLLLSAAVLKGKAKNDEAEINSAPLVETEKNGNNKADEKDAAQSSASMNFTIDAKSGILMEASSGRVLFEQNADEALPPASVTKIMTLLLIMEAVDGGVISLSDKVTASANATSMGGSQIYLKEGEEMTVEDLIKSVVISSANDAAVALAEYVSGSEEAFVGRMNERAAQLGMKNTYFENTNGLDDTTEKHLISARDIAIMSRELMKHKKILEYSSIWMDSVRDGAFGLTNTNRLIRFYRGATGLKTGSTSKAKFCISATAERDGMSLIAVVMGSPTRDVRNAEATKMLDWGFANYSLYKNPSASAGEFKVLGGVDNSFTASYPEFNYVVETGKLSQITYQLKLPDSFSAPLNVGDKVGEIVYLIGDEEIGRCDIVSDCDVKKIGFFGVMRKIIQYFIFPN